MQSGPPGTGGETCAVRSVDPGRVLDQARALIQGRYEIAHATLQVEPADHTGCDEVSW